MRSTCIKMMAALVLAILPARFSRGQGVPPPRNQARGLSVGWNPAVRDMVYAEVIFGDGEFNAMEVRVMLGLADRAIGKEHRPEIAVEIEQSLWQALASVALAKDFDAELMRKLIERAARHPEILPAQLFLSRHMPDRLPAGSIEMTQGVAEAAGRLVNGDMQTKLAAEYRNEIPYAVALLARDKAAAILSSLIAVDSEMLAPAMDAALLGAPMDGVEAAGFVKAAVSAGNKQARVLAAYLLARTQPPNQQELSQRLLATLPHKMDNGTMLFTTFTGDPDLPILGKMLGAKMLGELKRDVVQAKTPEELRRIIEAPAADYSLLTYKAWLVYRYNPNLYEPILAAAVKDSKTVKMDGADSDMMLLLSACLSYAVVEPTELISVEAVRKLAYEGPDATVKTNALLALRPVSTDADIEPLEKLAYDPTVLSWKDASGRTISGPLLAVQAVASIGELRSPKSMASLQRIAADQRAPAQAREMAVNPVWLTPSTLPAGQAR